MDEDKNVLLKLEIPGRYLNVKEVEVVPLDMYKFLRYVNPIIILEDIGFSNYSDEFNILYKEVTRDNDEIINFMKTYPFDESNYIGEYFEDCVPHEVKYPLERRLKESFSQKEVKFILPIILNELEKNKFDFLHILTDAPDFDNS